MDLLLLLIIIILPLISQIYINSCYSKYSNIKNSTDISGCEAARKILNANGLNDVDIQIVKGSLTDNYNPKTKKVYLSDSIYSGNSIAAVSVAAHECGHAIQDKEGYSFMTVRSKLVPAVNFSSKFAFIFIIIGLFAEIAKLYYIGIGLLLIGLLFQLVTLPVEYNASDRAKKQLKTLGIVSNNDLSGTNKMLKAAAFTYLAAFLANTAQIIRLVGISNRN